MPELLHVTYLTVESATDARSDSDGAPVLVQLHFTDSGGHDTHSTIDPVESERGGNELAEQPRAVHVLPEHGARDPHATLEAELFDLEGDEAPLLALRGVENGRLVAALERDRVLHLVEKLVVERVILVCRG